MINSNLFILGFVVVLLSSCPATDFVNALIHAYTPENATLNKTPEKLNDTNNITNKTDGQWLQINRAQAEKGCLKQAKKVAVDQGYSAALVFSCTCVAKETNITKSYDCDVSAMDGNHQVSINCVKAQNQCLVISEQGTDSYNFNELEKFANE